MVRLIGGLAMVTALVGAAHAQTATVNVQIINVCDDLGNNCALSSPGTPYAYNPTAIQRVFNQAGVAVRLLNPVQFNSSAYLNPAVIDDPADGYLTGNPVDPAHLLLNSPGHRQNTDPNVLNVFLVNSLPHTTALSGKITPASLLFGLGLQNANGAIATTGIFPSGTPGSYLVAGIDNIPHELGHNLGLLHVDGTADGSPYNLLQGQNRFVPNTVCGIAGTSCDAGGRIVPTGDPAALTVGQKDAVSPNQAAKIQASAANLFSVDLAQVSAKSWVAEYDYNRTGPQNIGCTNTGLECIVTFSYTQLDSLAPPGLVGVKLRYRSVILGNLKNRFVIDANLEFSACHQVDSENLLPGGDTEISYTFDPGCIPPNAQFSIDARTYPVNGQIIYDLTPFSAQFTFADGVTSRALFDSSGLALSTDPVEIGNVNTPNQDGPGLPIPTRPDLFNALIAVEDTGGSPVTAAGLLLTGDSTAVPEPGSVAVLGAALVALGARRRMVYAV